jgi:TRAP-type C4-dicarboxylate transport system substrate-binding protein
LTAAVLSPGSGLKAQEPRSIKFATLAPEGTVWMKAIQRADRELRAATGGQVRFKIYPGGVAGDERDMIRKMRLGQLHASGVTGSGLSDVVPEVHVLDVPFLFESGAEVDHVLEALLPEFQQRFEAKGFRLLGFTEAGFVHFYSRLPLASPSDFRSAEVKAWLWEGDVLNQAFFEAYRIPSVPLALPDVLSSLQTGMINTVFGPPAAAVALQWHTKIKYMTPIPSSWVVGGTLVTEKAWQELTPEQQSAFAEIAARLSKELLELTREDNRKAYEAMKKLGIEVTREPTREETDEFLRIAHEARRSVVGKLYSEELLARVEGLVQEYRAQHPAASP